MHIQNPGLSRTSSTTLPVTRLDEERDLARKQTLEKALQDPSLELVDWDGPNDPENPFNWPKWRKILITFIALLGTFTSLLNGTMITVAHNPINEEFGVSDASFPNSYWPVTSWSVGGGLFMMVILPLVEDFGVRWVYLASHVVFILFLIPQAVGQNFATLVVTRFFAGGSVSVLSNCVSAIICDIWEGDVGRTIPLSFFIATYLTATPFGPVIGAAIFQYLNWRWISYIQLIWSGVLFPVFFFFIRETRGSVLLRQRAQKIRRETGRKAYTSNEIAATSLWVTLKDSITRPMYMLCTEWVIFSFTIWSAFSVGTVYLFTQSVEQVFSGLYGWTAYQCGYVQAAIAIGMLLGWSMVFVSSRIYFASAKRNTESPGVPIPEARLYTAIFGGFVGMTGGMFVYAWTAYPIFPWIAPAVGLAMVGFGINVVVAAIAEYITDAYSKYAASAVAAVAFGENIFAGFLPLAAQSMYTNLGFHWASSLLGFLALLLSCIPVVLVIWGKQVRSKSPFMNKARYVVEKEIMIDGDLETASRH